jgi:hypothetical protein
MIRDDYHMLGPLKKNDVQMKRPLQMLKRLKSNALRKSKNY